MRADPAGGSRERSAAATAATPQRTPTAFGFSVSAAHPRLWWTPERLAQAKAWLGANRFNPSAEDYFHIAWKHAVAGTDCSPAIRWALDQQVPAAQHAPSANGSDVARWHGEDAILVYDWCHDQLSAQQRSDFLRNVGGSGKGWNDYLSGILQQRWGGPSMNQSNYNWGNLRNALELGIATHPENPPAEAFLTDAIVARWQTNFVPSASAGGAGGVGQEGTAYAAALLQYPIIPFQTMKLGGRDILNETSYFKESALWVLYGTTPAPTHNVGAGSSSFQLNPFGDDELFAEGGVLNRRSYYQNFMNFASNYWSGVALGKYARSWVETVGAHRSSAPTSPFVLAQDSRPAAIPYDSLPLDYYARGVQYLFGRRAWDRSSTYFMWQMGKGVDEPGHQHVDVGNFNIWRGGRWLTRETTGYSDVIAGHGLKRSRVNDDSGSIIAHNGVVFGTALYVDDVRLMPSVDSGQTVVRRLESNPRYVYADVDMTNRYRWSANYSGYDKGAVVHVERELLFLRQLETTLVLDRITTGDVTKGPDAGTTAANQVNTFVIHFETKPTLVDAARLTAVNGDQALRVTTLVPANPTRRVIDERSCPGCSRVGQHRVEIDTAGAAQRYFLHVLQARDASGADLAASVVDSAPGAPTKGTFTVTLHPSAGPDTTVVFDKGRTSSGGTVDLAGAGARKLRPDVQRIDYTDAGPAWASD